MSRCEGVGREVFESSLVGVFALSGESDSGRCSFAGAWRSAAMLPCLDERIVVCGFKAIGAGFGRAVKCASGKVCS